MSGFAFTHNNTPQFDHRYHQALLESVSKLLIGERVIKTSRSGMTIFLGSHHRAARPFIYNPGIAVVLQGRKIGRVDAREFPYGPGQYLLQTLPIPF